MFIATMPCSRFRRAVVLVALAVLSAIVVSCSSSGAPSPSHPSVAVADGGITDTGAPFPTDASRAPLDITTADLAAAGLSVFADANQATPMIPPSTAIEPSPYRVLLDQANAMIAEADARQGMLGSDFDALVVVPADLPPASYFLAGYVSAAGTPGARLSRKLMGTQDWQHAPTVVYPSLVFALFAADAARYANALAGPHATSATGATGTAGQPVTATVTLPGGLDEWPALIADCAKVAGVPLPPLKPVGAPVTWTFAQSPGALVSQNAGTAPALDDQASANVGYVTTTETEMAALGTAFEGKVMATVSIRRKEIADLQKTVADAVFSQIPGLIRPIVQGVLGPAVNAVLGLPPSLLDTHGYEPVVVTYHECETAVCCPRGQKACAGVCVDTTSDPSNCGDCGTVCPSGNTCASGACVPPPPAPKSCMPACPAGSTCRDGSCVPATIVASCTTEDGKGCNDFTGVNWTLATTKQSCPAPEIWSPSPCPTTGRLGTCLQFGDAALQAPPHDYSFVIRLYPGAATTFCNTCTSEGDCAESFNPMGPANPTHPCTGGCCDLRQNLQDAAIACNCTVPGDPGCPNWTPG